MKLKVPFYKQTPNVTCGPTSLRMVLAYFGKKVSGERLKKLSKQLDSGLTFPQGLAFAANQLGFKVKYYAKKIKAPDRRKTFFKKLIDKNDLKIYKELDKAMPGIKRNFTLKQLLDIIQEKFVPIVTLNWQIVLNKEGVSGHYVAIIGYDQKYVYCHHSGDNNPTPNLPIPKKIFYKAWDDSNKNTIIIR